MSEDFLRTNQNLEPILINEFQNWALSSLMQNKISFPYILERDCLNASRFGASTEALLHTSLTV